jgi:serine/threonine protein kinase
MTGKFDQYWKVMSKGKEPNFFSIAFKDLVTALFQKDPEKRPTIAQIRSHQWINGDFEQMVNIRE